MHLYTNIQIIYKLLKRIQKKEVEHQGRKSKRNHLKRKCQQIQYRPKSNKKQPRDGPQKKEYNIYFLIFRRHRKSQLRDKLGNNPKKQTRQPNIKKNMLEIFHKDQDEVKYSI